MTQAAHFKTFFNVIEVSVMYGMVGAVLYSTVGTFCTVRYDTVWIKHWECIKCPCVLCKTYLKDIGYV